MTLWNVRHARNVDLWTCERFGFGDSRKPLQETAALVEEVVHQQMVAMIHLAAEGAAVRGEKQIAIEDILFLLRKNKEKLKRLLRYYEVKDMKHIIKGSVTGGDDAGKAEILANQEKMDRKVMGKNRQVCYDFLSSIDQTGELVALFHDKEVDSVKHERLLRAELQAQGMDTQQYLDFCQARQANFSRKYTKSQRFRDWLQLNLNPEIQLSAAAVELFSYMAYEAVAQLVDLALLVKQDQRARPDDPVSRHRPPLCINYTDLYVGSVYSRGDVGSQSPGTDGQTSTSGHHLAAASVITKPNKKKRKRSGPPTTVDSDWDSTILPADVREAYRRYFTDISPFASINKNHSHCSPWSANLCT
ncbi:transcription initiation protein spt3-like protein [Plakobranchus ocellatus]|uniref:Transcription initiation protein spt3-like protein n=1 Tax=Plakobranchus ocellatus TaxID=259542 RepID=A0AAV4DXP2_9GAST|nr:transcription initiation protein spt3-like protein [Plakobranchus ocellatus]